MLAHTRKRLTNKPHANVVYMQHAGVSYIFPKNIANKYRLSHSSKYINSKDIFEKINKKYTKPGALLRGIRIRENLTQVQMAKEIKVTQSDISQMEKGIRNIGRLIAKRIEKKFGIDYRSFLE